MRVVVNAATPPNDLIEHPLTCGFYRASVFSDMALDSNIGGEYGAEKPSRFDLASNRRPWVAKEKI